MALELPGISRASRGAMYSLVCLLMLAMALPARAEAKKKPAPKSPPNIVVISLDTLRADTLGCYGYKLPTSPQIDRMAGFSTRYARCVSTSAWTLPSHVSMFTGLYPFEHGVRTYKTGSHSTGLPKLAKDIPTLAEVLQEQDYYTGAFVANTAYLNTRFAVDRGFDEYHLERIDSSAMQIPIFKWVHLHKRSPFFLFVNVMDTHRPYRTHPPAPFTEGELHPDRHLIYRLYEHVMSPEGVYPDAALQLVRNQYDNSVYHADRFVGFLLAFLAAQGLLDNTIFVVTSDHGEYIGEHRLVEHSKDVYQEAVHVPLLIKGLGKGEGRVVRETVSGADLPHLIGQEIPGKLGKKLRTLFPRRDKIITENYYTRGRDLANESWGFRFDRIRTGYYSGDLKLIASSDLDHELYNLKTDPREQSNLAKSESDTMEQMIKELSELKAGESRDLIDDVSDDEYLTPEEIHELEALGYL